MGKKQPVRALSPIREPERVRRRPAQAHGHRAACSTSAVACWARRPSGCRATGTRDGGVGAQFGPIARWGIEGASGLGRHTAMYLIGQGHDVRDVCPTRTAEQARRRRNGKTDALDAVRVARETQADPAMPTAFKRAAGDAGPDETHELMLVVAQGSPLDPHLPPAPPERSRSTSSRELPEPLRGRAARHQGRSGPACGPGRHADQRRGTPPPRCGSSCSTRHATPCRPRRDRTARPPASSRNSPSGRIDDCRSCAASPTGSRPNCSSKSVTPAASPAKAASPASTAPPRSQPPPPRATTNRSAIASTAAATDASTPASIASPSPSCAATLAPARSTTTPAPRPHQEGSHAHPQAPPQRRRLPPHGTRPRTTPPTTHPPLRAA